MSKNNEMEFESDNHSIFTENLGDVSLKTSLETEITVELSGVPGRTAESFSFFLAPTDGKITIRTSEIARRLLTRHETTVEVIVPNPIYEWGMESRDLPTLKLTAHNASGDAEWSTRVTAGGYGEKEIGDETEFLTHNFLTWRPQISITYPGLKEQLTFIDPTEGVFRAMRLRMYFGKELPTDETIVRSNGIGLRRIDVSPAAVSALAVYKGIDDVLTAYDLYGIANEAPGANAAWDTPIAQRFIIGRRDLRQTSFFFQNSLGGFDTVTAKGVRSCQPEGETVSFTNGRTEEMLETGFTDTWEVNTGFIRTRQEKALWDEFLSSTNKYLLLPDGSHRRIVVDEFDATYTYLELSSYTFTYRLAAAETGHAFTRKILKDFIG